MLFVRRFISVLLVPALLANQAAICCAHAHSESSTTGYSTRSHMHTSHGAHDHDGHSHEHNSDSGSDGNSNELPSDQANLESGIKQGIPSNHDEDALFVSDPSTIQTQSRVITFEGMQNLAFVPSFVCFSPTVQPVFEVDRRHAGPSLPYSCAIWLQTRALLI